MKISVFWFRRDLRLHDNAGLSAALKSGMPVLPVFIFDTNILDNLEAHDPRVAFIHNQLFGIGQTLKKCNSSLKTCYGTPRDAWQKLCQDFEIGKVFWNKDYEPHARKRDDQIEKFLQEKGIEVVQYKDQVIMEEQDVLKTDGSPYTVFTPYKRKWLSQFSPQHDLTDHRVDMSGFINLDSEVHSLKQLGFKPSSVTVRPFRIDHLSAYATHRNFPALDATSSLSPHLRFGTVSVREIFRALDFSHETFLSELIWREFFMQILFHFPHVVAQSFRKEYDQIEWRNNEGEFEKWCRGATGYPLVDAGMRQLNNTGYMHNRVRMVVASFLCKDLLIDWRWGEAYFATKLLDYDLSANNGNWQWAAGSGCDAAPYFRIFNPSEQLKKFDPNLEYVKKWVPEVNSPTYPPPMVDHGLARSRTLKAYQVALA